MKSIADAFKNPNAVFNDPLYEIHNPIVSKLSTPPVTEEYDHFLTYLTPGVYPKPTNKFIHHAINPSHGTLKPISIKNNK